MPNTPNLHASTLEHMNLLRLNIYRYCPNVGPRQMSPQCAASDRIVIKY